MIEDVEHLGAEVQRLTFCQYNLFEQREIAVHQLGANERVPAEISDRVDGLQHKGVRVEPVFSVAGDRIVGKTRADIRTLMNREVDGIQVSRLVVAESHFKGRPGLRRHDTIELPAFHKHTGKACPAASKRQFVAPVRYYDMLHRKAGKAAVLFAIINTNRILSIDVAILRVNSARL